jgi:hypothetical protein
MRLRKLVLALVVASPMAACETADNVGRGANEVGAGLGDALSAPLEDLNLKRTPIPSVLIRAEANPYAIGGMDHCEAIAAEVGSLDDALGPDADTPPPDRTQGQKEADASAHATLGVVHGAAESALPFHSWVRQLSGAERHRRDVQAAIKAGSQRRGFLKALGMSMNCAPPAAPSWYKPRVQPAADAHPSAKSASPVASEPLPPASPPSSGPAPSDPR